MSETNSFPTPENQPEHQPPFEVHSDDALNTLTPQVRDELRSLFPEEEFQSSTSEEQIPFSEEEVAELGQVFMADQEAGYQAEHDRYITSGIKVASAIDETMRATTAEVKRQHQLRRELKKIDPPRESDAEIKSEKAWKRLGARATTDLAPRFNR